MMDDAAHPNALGLFSYPRTSPPRTHELRTHIPSYPRTSYPRTHKLRILFLIVYQLLIQFKDAFGVCA